VDWDVPYVVSRSLSLEVARTGRLAGTTSLSRRPAHLDPEGVPVLLAFAAGSTPRDAFERLQEEWEIESEGFEELVHRLLEENFLLPAGTGIDSALAPAENFGSIHSHLYMLRDVVRVMSYREAIRNHAPGRTVAEVGCGTGVLSLFAARAGARKVIAIEESRIAEVAAAMIEANGCSGLVELRIANSRDVELDEPVDLIIHEILGTDPFEEGLLPVLQDVRERLLKPGGRLLPYRLEVCCVAIELEERSGSDRARMLAEARELERLSGLYGVELGPVREAVAKHEPRVQRTRFTVDKPLFDRKVLSEETRILDLDLQKGDLELAGQLAPVPLRISRPGILGGVALFFRAHLDETIQLTNSPFARATTWGWDVRTFSQLLPVAAGDEVSLAVEVETTFRRQMLQIDVAPPRKP
jgi:precorrin-6B methylase 2